MKNFILSLIMGSLCIFGSKLNAMEAEEALLNLEEIASNNDVLHIVFEFKKELSKECSTETWRNILRIIIEAVNACKSLTQEELHTAMDIMTNALMECKTMRDNDGSIIGTIGISLSAQPSSCCDVNASCDETTPSLEELTAE